ncbi:hypothetical protein [Pseudonocardia spinosispora]|uniref:hypothetical protein n=1 Tax=Pseudonocardia spinosispora TaxID=103441 RepID=UPI0012EC5749|nr:hypothetical protein [Pseudonocardia spinosispora]
MPRHRAPSAPSRALTTLTGAAVTGVALGASMISPALASAAPATTDSDLSTGTTPAHLGHNSDDSSEDASRHHRKQRHHRTLARPMTSGEQQYRNGCKQGYIKQDCDQFTVTHLLRKGINPFL